MIFVHICNNGESRDFALTEKQLRRSSLLTRKYDARNTEQKLVNIHLDINFDVDIAESMLKNSDALQTSVYVIAVAVVLEMPFEYINKMCTKLNSAQNLP